MDNTTIYVTSEREKSVALSSSEVEYNALAEGGTVVAWLRCLSQELGTSQDKTIIGQDNSRVIEWVNEGSTKHFAQRKHIDMKMNFIMASIKKETIATMKVYTKECWLMFWRCPWHRRTLQLQYPSNEFLISTIRENMLDVKKSVGANQYSGLQLSVMHIAWQLIRFDNCGLKVWSLWNVFDRRWISKGK